jgi:hypothetical protein
MGGEQPAADTWRVLHVTTGSTAEVRPLLDPALIAALIAEVNM